MREYDYEIGGDLGFTYHRTKTRSTVRVFKFTDDPGCFVNPNIDEFFVDPQFAVKVDVGNAVPETAVNRANNNRPF